MAEMYRDRRGSETRTGASGERERSTGETLRNPTFIKKKPAAREISLQNIKDLSRRPPSFSHFSPVSPLPRPRFIKKAAYLPYPKPNSAKSPLADQSLSAISTDASVYTIPSPIHRARDLSKGYKLRRKEWEQGWKQLSEGKKA